jgi:hypothetical protein
MAQRLNVTVRRTALEKTVDCSLIPTSYYWNWMTMTNSNWSQKSWPPKNSSPTTLSPTILSPTTLKMYWNWLMYPNCRQSRRMTIRSCGQSDDEMSLNCRRFVCLRHLHRYGDRRHRRDAWVDCGRRAD